jgi:hypothetical protein
MLAAVIPFTPRYSPIVPRPRAARVPQKGENSTRRRIFRAFPGSPDPRNLVAGSQRRPTVPTIVDQTFTLSASKTSSNSDTGAGILCRVSAKTRQSPRC